MKNEKKNEKQKRRKRLGRFSYVLCVALLIALDTVALADVVTIKSVFGCSGNKILGTDLGFTYKKSDTQVWFVTATEINTGIQFHAYVDCYYDYGLFGIGATDSCYIWSKSPVGICNYAAVQCGGMMGFTNTVTGESSSMATVSHDADVATFRIVFGTY